MPVCDKGCELGHLCIHYGPGKDAYQQGFAQCEWVLSNLVAELCSIHVASNLRGDHQWCVRDEEKWPCETMLAIQHMEAKFRKVTNE